eukprot:SAG22_NODE_33_length_27588_cov_104.174652_13_plen_315_part_00
MRVSSAQLSMADSAGAEAAKRFFGVVPRESFESDEPAGENGPAAAEPEAEAAPAAAPTPALEDEWTYQEKWVKVQEWWVRRGSSDVACCLSVGVGIFVLVLLLVGLQVACVEGQQMGPDDSCDHEDEEDGQCDEGGRHLPCGTGTDCTDCGWCDDPDKSYTCYSPAIWSKGVINFCTFLAIVGPVVGVIICAICFCGEQGKDRRKLCAEFLSWVQSVDAWTAGDWFACCITTMVVLYVLILLLIVWGKISSYGQGDEVVDLLPGVMLVCGAVLLFFWIGSGMDNNNSTQQQLRRMRRGTDLSGQPDIVLPYRHM